LAAHIAGFTVAPTEEETLQHLLQSNLLAHKVQLQDISDAASREHALEKQLDKMQAEWVSSLIE
jgi:dynein heavy chain